MCLTERDHTTHHGEARHTPAGAAIKFQSWVCFLSCVRPITEKNGMSRDTVLLCDWPYTGKNIGPKFETLLQKWGVPAETLQIL